MARVYLDELTTQSAMSQEEGAARPLISGNREIDDLVFRHAKRTGLDPAEVFAVMEQESRFNPEAVSPKGARGLMQIMPATAKDPGYGVNPLRDWSLDEQVRFGTDYYKAVGPAAYNAGPGRVEEIRKGLAQMPAETAAYVPEVEKRQAKFQQKLGGQKRLYLDELPPGTKVYLDGTIEYPEGYKPEQPRVGLGRLGEIEQRMETAQKEYAAQKPEGRVGLGRLDEIKQRMGKAQEGYKAGAPTGEDFVKDLFVEGPSAGWKMAYGGLKALFSNLSGPFEELRRKKGIQTFEAGGKDLEEIFKKEYSTLQKDAISAGVSLSQNFATILAALATGRPGVALAGMGLLESGRSFGEAKSQNASDATAHRYAFGNMLAEVAGEWVTLKYLFKLLPGSRKAIRKFGEFYLSEVGSELGTETVQAVNEAFHFAELADLSLGELKEVWRATAVQTSMTVPILGLFGIGGARFIQRRLEDKIKKELNTDEELAKLVGGDLSDADKRKLLEQGTLDPEKVKRVEELLDAIGAIQAEFEAHGEQFELDRAETVKRNLEYFAELDFHKFEPVLGEGERMGFGSPMDVLTPLIERKIKKGEFAATSEGRRAQARKAMPEKGTVEVFTGGMNILAPEGKTLANYVQKLVGAYAPNARVVLNFSEFTGSNNGHLSYSDSLDTYVITFNAPRMQEVPLEFLRVAQHEVGHLIAAETLRDLTPNQKAALLRDYYDWLESTDRAIHKGQTFEEFVHKRGAISQGESPRISGTFQEVHRKPHGFFYRNRVPAEYWASFDEWFAERVSAALQLQLVEKGRGEALTGEGEVWNTLVGRLKDTADLWAESIETGEKFSAGTGMETFLEYTRLTNELSRVLKEMGFLTEDSRTIPTGIPALDSVNGTGSVVPQANAILSAQQARRAGDAIVRYNGFMRLGLNLLQMAKENEDVPGIQEYVHTHVQEFWRTKTQWALRADTRLKEWNKIVKSKEDKNKFGQFLHEVTLASDAKGKRLTADEFMEVFDRIKATDKQIAMFEPLFRKVDGDFRIAINSLFDVLDKDARIRFNDNPVVLGKMLRKNSELREQYTDRHFFPLSRFGNYAITVRAEEDLVYEEREFKKGEVVLFELYEREKDRWPVSLLSGQDLSQEGRFRELRKKLDSRFKVLTSVVSDEATMYQGMPIELTDRIVKLLEETTVEFYADGGMSSKEKELLEQQIEAVKVLSQELSPGNSFKQRLQRRQGTLGWSTNAMRGYAAYFQNFSNFIARIQYHHEMMGSIKQVKHQAAVLREGQTIEQQRQSRKAMELARYMERHYTYLMNPGNELANVRAVGFIWYLGMVPKSAFVNLTQVGMVAQPYLAAEFGQARAAGALLASYGQIVKLFQAKTAVQAEDLTTPTLDMLSRKTGMDPDFLEALKLGLEYGFINESLATELGAIADGSMLGRLAPGALKPGHRAESMIRWVSHKAAFLFQQAETLNRLVTFAAAYKLEKQKIERIRGPIEQLSEADQKIVKDTIFGVAKTTVQDTMFEYARWNRAEIMRGKKSVFFLFKQYLQGISYFAARQPGGRQFLLQMLFLAGLSGLPFAEDLFDLIDGVANSKPFRGALRMLGIDYGYADTRSWIRTYAKNVSDQLGLLDEFPDLVMHGGGRYALPTPIGPIPGLGLLHKWDSMIPSSDISGSLGLGRMLPGAQALGMFMKGIELDEGFREVMEEVTGPVGAAVSGMFNALDTSEPSMWKRTENLMPMGMRWPSKAIRRLVKGEETYRGGAAVREYDWTDPADIIAASMALFGFQETLLSQKGGARWVMLQQGMYWQAQRSSLMLQYYTALKSGDREAGADVRRAIAEYNKHAPPGLKLGPDNIVSSMEQRQRAEIMKERGLPVQKSHIPMAQQLRELYPTFGAQ